MIDTPAPTHNIEEYSVTEISGALKKTVESRFNYVRVRGEISGFKRAASGHLYMDLKDEKSVLNAVCWKGVAARLACAPENGLEVVCSGKLTTYGGRSNYQMVIDQMELAGAGALMALLEQRKKQLEAEGLFAPERKQELPFIPKVIGVITSPTGAVIQDILHRLGDRFPVHVLVWPVRVQGQGAELEIANAIDGFNAMPEDGDIPKPDVLIVARGGGSLEDLWSFNEEIVVRAAANSFLPLISAVGHETDVTLIDYVADKRAPTPTAAAEMAVPVRTELMATVRELDARNVRAMQRVLADRKRDAEGLARGLPNPESLLGAAAQRLDDWSSRLSQTYKNYIEQKTQSVALFASRLVSPSQRLSHQRELLKNHGDSLSRAMSDRVKNKRHDVDVLANRLTSARPSAQRLEFYRKDVNQYADRLARACLQNISNKRRILDTLGRIIEQSNYQQILKRGFALVLDEKTGNPVTAKTQIASGQKLRVQFHDGETKAAAE